MNKIAPVTYSEEDMLSILDGQIDQTVSAGKSVRSAITPFLNMLLHDSALQRSFVAWAIDARVGQRNAEADGLVRFAQEGRLPCAGASATNSDDSGQLSAAATCGRQIHAASSLTKDDENGRPRFASNGRCAYAASSSPNGDGVGHPLLANGRSTSAAPSPTHRDTDGHVVGAQMGQLPSAVPYREPSSAELKGRLSAKFRVAERILTSLDTYLIGGKPIGDKTIAELRTDLDDNVEKSAVLRQVLRCAANLQPNQRVRDVVKPTDLDEMIRKAKELVDVA